jgi:hypothetical protein
MSSNKTTKPFEITKQMVWEACKRVCAKGGSAGIDDQTIEDFNKDLKHNLYKIWNRMASGSYFPPAVKRVEIPKADGGLRWMALAGQESGRLKVESRRLSFPGYAARSPMPNTTTFSSSFESFSVGCC